MGTKELAVYNNGSVESKWILRSNSAFLFRKQSKYIFGNIGDFGNSSGEHGTTNLFLGDPQ